MAVGKNRKIIVIGAPGSGKGTQAMKMAQYLGCRHLSTGDILRSVTKRADLVPEEKRTPNQAEIIRSVRSGCLVSDDIVYELLEREIKNLDMYVLDGFPRNLEQAGKVDANLVIFINTDPCECTRRICSRCEGRADDNEKTAEYRMDTYFRETFPLVEHYREKGVLATVDGNKSVEAVTESIIRILK